MNPRFAATYRMVGNRCEHRSLERINANGFSLQFLRKRIECLDSTFVTDRFRTRAEMTGCADD